MWILWTYSSEPSMEWRKFYYLYTWLFAFEAFCVWSFSKFNSYAHFHLCTEYNESSSPCISACHSTQDVCLCFSPMEIAQSHCCWFCLKTSQHIHYILIALPWIYFHLFVLFFRCAISQFPSFQHRILTPFCGAFWHGKFYTLVISYYYRWFILKHTRSANFNSRNSD